MTRRLPGYLTIAVLVLVIYWIALAIATHIPKTAMGVMTIQVWDKLAHFVAYLGLSLLLCLVFVRAGSRRGLKYVAVGLLAILYGGIDEAWQSFVPGRQADILDWIADVAGVLAGIGLHLFICRCWRGKLQSDNASYDYQQRSSSVAEGHAPHDADTT